MLRQPEVTNFAERAAKLKERRDLDEQARRRSKQAQLGAFFTNDGSARASLGATGAFPQSSLALQQHQEALQAQHLALQRHQLQQEQQRKASSSRLAFDEDDDRPSLPFPSGSDNAAEETAMQPKKTKKKETFKLLGPAQPVKISATFDETLNDPAPAVASSKLATTAPAINPWDQGDEEGSKDAQIAPVAGMPSSPTANGSDASTIEWDPADFLPHLLKDWVTKLPPCDAASMIQCRILRRKEGLDRLNPRYELYLEGKQRIFLMAAKRKHRVTLKGKASNYIITIRPMTLMMEKEDCVGKLK